MHLLVSTLSLVCLFVSPAIASATTFGLADGAEAVWRLQVTATDGISTVVVFNERIPMIENSVGFLEAEPVGVINHAFRVEGFDIRLQPISFSTTIGTANIPVQIELEEAVFAGGFPLDEELILFVGDPSSTLVGAKPRTDSLRGRITANGTTAEFDFSNDVCNEPGGSCPISLRAVSQTEIQLLGTGIYVNGSVGPIDGVDYTVSMSPSFGRTSFQVIPEPSTASLLGLGLVGIAAKRRRRAARAQ